MICSATRIEAVKKMQLPSQLYFTAAGLQPKQRAIETLLVESDGEWWFNPKTVLTMLKLEGLTEAQVEVKLFTGHSHCEKCKADLSVVGFYDFDIDTARIQHQFACKKCRHQWGPKASGAKDSSLVAEKAAPRTPGASVGGKSAYTPPAGGSVTGRVWELADAILAEGPREWKALRAAIVVAGEAAGIHPATVATQAAKWRKGRGIG